jgi:hypothetical protein
MYREQLQADQVTSLIKDMDYFILIRFPLINFACGLCK